MGVSFREPPFVSGGFFLRFKTHQKGAPRLKKRQTRMDESNHLVVHAQPASGKAIAMVRG